MSTKHIAVAACFILATAGTAAARAATLAQAAEEFAARELGLPQGSVRAQFVDPRLPLGECNAGWKWSFPFSSRGTVQAQCADAGVPKRFVSIAVDGTPATMQATAAANRQTPAGKAVVAIRDLPFGHVLSADDLKVVAVEEGDRPAQSNLTDPESILGSALSRAVRAGEYLGRADAHAAVVVRRKKMVSGWSSFAGGRVVTQLIAQQDGKAGDWIELENPQSGRKLRGQVQIDGSVQLGSGRLGSYGTLATTSQIDPKGSAGRAD